MFVEGKKVKSLGIISQERSCWFGFVFRSRLHIWGFECEPMKWFISFTVLLHLKTFSWITCEGGKEWVGSPEGGGVAWSIYSRSEKFLCSVTLNPEKMRVHFPFHPTCVVTVTTILLSLWRYKVEDTLPQVTLRQLNILQFFLPLIKQLEAFSEAHGDFIQGEGTVVTLRSRESTLVRK